MSESTVVQIGVLSLTLSQLKLGQLKRVQPELRVLASIQGTALLLTEEQIDAITTLAFVSANVADPSLTKEQVVAAIDDLPWDTGLTQLVQMIPVLLKGSGAAPPTA
jgi:MFS superfamily sulfate permease-like transporter